MTAEQFEELVAKLESQALRDPKGYRMRVLGLAILGYVYLFLVLTVLLVLFGILVWYILHHGLNYATMKLTIALGALIFLMLASLWVTIPPFTGIVLTRQNVPKLFAMLDELCAKLDAPKFHTVLLNDDFNARVGQRPRLGILGWYRSYLLVGLPYLQATSPQQFRAVIAHELGHLSGNHGKFGAWIYRQRRTWGQVLENFNDDGGFFDAIFQRFFRWYAPYFFGYTFVLARANEYEADRVSVEAAGKEVAGDALIVAHLQSRTLKNYWKEVYEAVDRQPEPPAQAFTKMSQSLRQTPDESALAAWIDRALSIKTDLADTHPALTDRLKAMGWLLDGVDPLTLIPDTPPQSAAEFYFESALPHYLERLDAEWQAAIAPAWQQRYEYAQEAQKRLVELDAKAQTEALAEEELFEQVSLTTDFRGQAAALPLWKALFERLPDMNPAKYGYGSSLLAVNDAAGIALIEQVMDVEPETIESGVETILEFLTENATLAEADAYRKAARQRFDTLEEGANERKTVKPKDKLLPHALTAEEVQALAAQLRTNSQVKAAYLVRKKVVSFPNKPMYVLGIVENFAWYQFRSDGRTAKLVETLTHSLEFPHFLHVVVFDRNQKKLKKPMEAQAHSLILQR